MSAASTISKNHGSKLSKNMSSSSCSKSSPQKLRNSQSLANINMQPRAFITRNVKLRQKLNQNNSNNNNNNPNS